MIRTFLSLIITLAFSSSSLALVIDSPEDLVVINNPTTITFGANINRVIVPYTRVEMLGGRVNEMVGVSATVDMTFGHIDSIDFGEFSTVNMALGYIGSLKMTGEENNLNVFGGVIEDVQMAHISNINITFGLIDSIRAARGSSINVLGGHIGALSGFEYGTVSLYYNHGIDLSGLDPTATVVYVSEPALLGLIGIATIGLVLCRRRDRIA